MRILLVSQYFWPETFRINDLACELGQRGHEVTVLTGKPNYPSGKVADGYRWWGYTEETWNGIRVIRVPLLPRGNASGMRLAANYLSYVFFSCLYVLFHKRKYDVSLTFAISPITQVYAALLHKALYKSKAYIWVQDLWPESVTAAGKFQNGRVLKLLSSMVKGIYRKVDGILIQSEAFRESIDGLGDFSSKIHYVPNWAEELFEKRAGMDEKKFAGLVPGGFNIMFAGNIGEAQCLSQVIEAAEMTKGHSDIHWLIVGDGRKRVEMEEYARRKGLDNILFLGRYPMEDMPSLFVHAKAMLVSLKDEYIFSLTIPAKTQSYMAFGKPVLTIMNGIGNEVVREAKCGYTAAAGDFRALADNAIRMSRLPEEEITAMGTNALEYYQSHFSRRQVIDSIVSIFEQGLR